ncbi:Vacuolar sorting protein 18 [Camellia lanceoleosa]|uniref:Vacuolar sorting protein 18 n=1 Tax=Camellia lanceoleosa TaxID=1840588 RepID=A0ACC0FRR1_9ERIC|nr:Vacuolar sorting protein 18 [Camellia lanceoleosa]
MLKMHFSLILVFLPCHKYEDDSALLRFLQCKFGKGRVSGPKFFYGPKYALRLCLKEKQMRACVYIYSMMSMHEEAIALSLQGSASGGNCMKGREGLGLAGGLGGGRVGSCSGGQQGMEAICSSLENYNKQIEQLKQEMNDATNDVDNIRNDISALAQRYAVIDCDQDYGVTIFRMLFAIDLLSFFFLLINYYLQ